MIDEKVTPLDGDMILSLALQDGLIGQAAHLLGQKYCHAGLVFLNSWNDRYYVIEAGLLGVQVNKLGDRLRLGSCHLYGAALPESERIALGMTAISHAWDMVDEVIYDYPGAARLAIYMLLVRLGIVQPVKPLVAQVARHCTNVVVTSWRRAAFDLLPGVDAAKVTPDMIAESNRSVLYS